MIDFNPPGLVSIVAVDVEPVQGIMSSNKRKQSNQGSVPVHLQTIVLATVEHFGYKPDVHSAAMT
eukprot:365910-Chlamydomonas_euryale.AAC.13